MTVSSADQPLPFPELWERFLAWRIAILEGNLSPKQVFQEVDPKEELEIGQFLTDERHLALERLLLNPDPDLRLAFTKTSPRNLPRPQHPRPSQPRPPNPHPLP